MNSNGIDKVERVFLIAERYQRGMFWFSMYGYLFDADTPGMFQRDVIVFTSPDQVRGLRAERGTAVYYVNKLRPDTLHRRMLYEVRHAGFSVVPLWALDFYPDRADYLLMKKLSSLKCPPAAKPVALQLQQSQVRFL